MAVHLGPIHCNSDSLLRWYLFMNTPHDVVDLQALLDCIQEFIVVKDGAGRWLFCNETALVAYGMSGFAYHGLTDVELMAIRPQFADAFTYNLATDAKAWHNRSPTIIEKSFMGTDHRINTWEVVKTPSFNPDGSRYRLVIVSRNITERKLAENALHASEERFKNLAYLDPLTGIPNRRGILDMIALALNTAEAGSQSAPSGALLYLDLDRFKLINDTLGHEVGDDLLIAFAGRGRSCLREQDLFGRIGGDEFVVFLPDTDPEAALSVARRLCEALSRLWHLGNHQIHTSSSIGIAFTPEAGTDVHTLLRHADEALYRAKRAGRSQINTWRHES